MSDFRCCTQEFVSQFIDLYRSEPCLWKVKSKEYSDRTKKSKAYGKLVEKMREVDPGADRETVTKKINSLRCAFRKELKKVEKSRKIAISPDDVYVPHLWYYNQLGFLIDQENDSSTSDVLSPDMIEKTVEISLVEDSHSHLASPTNDSCISRESENYITHDAKNPVLTSFQQRIERKRKALGADEACTVLSLIAERMNSSRPEDEYDIIGKNIAAKLRRLPHSQSVYAEKLIYDVLFEAELGNLNKT